MINLSDFYYSSLSSTIQLIDEPIGTLDIASFVADGVPAYQVRQEKASTLNKKAIIFTDENIAYSINENKHLCDSLK